ncbi:MAG: hypothetical protein RLY86_192 [Pseudomonadota bacterium]|jgi:hypothetical protein
MNRPMPSAQATILAHAPAPAFAPALALATCLIIAVAGLMPGVARAATDPIHTGTFSSLAVNGHDPVAYFTEGKPVKGAKEFTYRWKDADWRFASAENRDRFIADPERYAPQYGGYCAWAVSEGYTAAGDPKHWKIVEGKLYLNYNAEIQTRWEGDVPGHIRKADTNWPTILAK